MKTTLITGASGGIGEAFARRLASEKHHLLLVARSEDKLKALCKELSSAYAITANYLALDLLDPTSLELLYGETEEKELEIDWLINNAGFGSMGEFSKLDQQPELHMITLNIQVLVALSHHYLQQMRERKSGTIINLSSIAAFQPIPYMATYAATKTFVKNFTEAIARENESYGIQVMLLCPGATETGFFDSAKINQAGKDAIMGTQVETPEMVVDAAMKGISKHQTVVISGFRNWLLARSTAFVPNSLITKVLSKTFGRYFK